MEKERVDQEQRQCVLTLQGTKDGVETWGRLPNRGQQPRHVHPRCLLVCLRALEALCAFLQRLLSDK
jgi:hypothetical protein